MVVAPNIPQPHFVPSKWDYSIDQDRLNRTPAYHGYKDAAYLLPNDSPEKLRLNAQAYFLSALMSHRPLHAPVDVQNTARALDIGCGTGTITDALADMLPRALCYGLDLSEIGDLDGHPSNVQLLKGNFLTQKPSEWINRSGRAALADDCLFDYTFSRLLLGGMHDWPGFLKMEFDMLKPGGWTEAHEIDVNHYFDDNGEPISDDWEWNHVLANESRKTGVDWGCGTYMKERMEKAGFTDIQVFTYKWPFGHLARKQESRDIYEAARFTDISWPELFHHMLARLLGGVTEQGEIERLRAQMYRDLSPDVKKWVPIIVTIGRKPL